MTPSGTYPNNNGGHHRFALRYRPGTDRADRSPGLARGRFRTREEAERVRAHCPHADQIEVVDVREMGAVA